MSELNIDRDKCTQCGRCVNDCIVKALCCTDEKITFAPGGENACINCQHCVAICPTGALSINGVGAADCPPTGAIPEAGEMMNLIRQRRSIRKFKNRALSPEKLTPLIASLDWTPTECNYRGLSFFIAGPEEVAKIRAVTNKWLRRLIKSGLLGLFMPRYKRYFSAVLDGEDVIYRDAPHLIIVTVSKKSPCKHSDPFIALTQFDLFAQTLGAGCCWCGFAEYAFKLIPELRRMIGVPAGHKIGAAMLFGEPQLCYARATMPKPLPVKHELI